LIAIEKCAVNGVNGGSYGIETPNKHREALYAAGRTHSPPTFNMHMHMGRRRDFSPLLPF
jgi:hypothetical protein